MPNVNGPLADVGTGTGVVVFVAVAKTSTVVAVFTAVCTGTEAVVFTAVCTGTAVVVLSFTGVVSAVATVLLTGACVWTCRPVAATRELLKKRMRTRTNTDFFSVRYHVFWGRTGSGSIRRAPYG